MALTANYSHNDSIFTFVGRPVWQNPTPKCLHKRCVIITVLIKCVNLVIIHTIKRTFIRTIIRTIEQSSSSMPVD